MKTIGLIGGMSWESTLHYYRIINDKVKNLMGGLHSAKIFLYSVDFDEIEKCQSSGDWDASARILTDAAKKLEASGCDFILICTNTMHKIVPEMEKEITIPIIHIADATADELEKDKVKTVALLGTKYTMTQDFYKERLLRRNINVVIPDEEDVEIINSVIYDELCLGKVLSSSREKYRNIIAKLVEKGAQGIIFGCTEIGLLVDQSDSSVKVYDTTKIHARKAADLAVKE